MPPANDIDPSLSVALEVRDATFKWVASAPEEVKLGVNDSQITLAEPFAIKGLNMEVPRRKLVAVIGGVGAGKSSLLQAVNVSCTDKGLKLTLTASLLERCASYPAQ